MIPTFLLPSNVKLKADSIIFNKGNLNLNVSACQHGSQCPLCKKTSHRVHSKYTRMLADLPVSGHQSRIDLIVRKYFCDNPMCKRKIFTERFQFEIYPYKRRLNRTTELLYKIALELGGNTGSKISRYMGIPVSPSTVLRIIKLPEINYKPITSGIIGIDDWAFKKGNTYGTVIVDLENREVIDLLPDRESETLANWLIAHPEIRVISRDRAGPYALGARKGAPQAIQVADRFHLLMNLGEVTKRVFQSKRKELKDAYKIYNKPITEKTPNEELLKPTTISNLEEKHIPATINVKRQYIFEKVKELRLAGKSILSIAKTLKAHRQTVKKYINAEEYPKRECKCNTQFDSYLEYLLHESNHDKSMKELHRAIVNMGFKGKYTQFCYNFKMISKGERHRIKDVTQITPMRIWSPTRLSMMLYMDPKKLSVHDNEFLNLLFDQYPDIKQLEHLVKTFKDLFIKKKDGLLKTWINEAMRPESLLKNFASNLMTDFKAINNAVTTSYSNGQVEGQVNRLKNIKRRMYGRAGFLMLKKMVLVKSG
jgi:transposase